MPCITGEGEAEEGLERSNILCLFVFFEQVMYLLHNSILL